MQKIFFGLLLTALISGCKEPDETVTGTPIARAFDSYLYLEELEQALPGEYTQEDSLQFATLFIDTWLRDQALLHKAEFNLSDEEKDVQQQLDQLRMTLLIYAYENLYVSQNLDTNVNEKEIKEYYLNNEEEFILKDYIVKVVYAKFEKTNPDIRKVSKWFKSTNDDDRDKFISHCQQNATNFYYDEQAWLRFDDLLKEIPIETYNKEAFIKKKRIEFEDDYYIYFLNFLDHRLKDDISPLSLERDNIKAIILNKRKSELVEKMRKDIVTDAFNSQDLEIYGN